MRYSIQGLKVLYSEMEEGNLGLGYGTSYTQRKAFIANIFPEYCVGVFIGLFKKYFEMGYVNIKSMVGDQECSIKIQSN